MTRTVAIIPARAGSVGIIGKNIKDFGGKPLLAWTIQAVLESRVICDVVVSTESEEIGQVAVRWGARWEKRPVELSTPEIQTDEVALFTLHQLKRFGDEYDTVLLLQPTSPFRTADDISEAFIQYQGYTDNKGCLLSVYEDMKFHWEIDYVPQPVNHWPEKRVGRQWRDPGEMMYTENGAIYIFPAERFLRERCYRLPPYSLYVMPENRSADLDTMDDWNRAVWMHENGMTK